MAVFDSESRTAWISKGFEHLVASVRDDPGAVHFDVLIIGSGYGGAVAAATLAGRTSNGAKLRVAVLERGNEYLPGAFPTGLAELPAHVRHDGNRQGLFDVRLGSEVTVVVANGLGGGSLINAGVMETPRSERFQSGWPAELSDLSTWRQFYDRAAEMVGARIGQVPNRIDDHPDGLPLKHHALRNLAPPGKFRSAEITVAMDDRTNGAHVRLRKCLRCGDCATGCNFGAKESLDLGLLVQARRAGAEIFGGGTVLHVSQNGQTWIADAVFTDKNLRLRDGSVTRIRASKVIIAAGTLGSNEILMRSHAAGLPVSAHRLGQRCSTNGDMLAVDFDTSAVVNTVADEAVQPSARQIGPTITGVIDLRDTSGVLIQEISVPASLRVAFGEVFGSVNALHALQDIDWSSHATGFPVDDGYAIPPQSIRRSSVFAIMGDDGAAGSIVIDDLTLDPHTDGMAYMRWPGDEPDTFASGIDTVSGLTDGTGGRLIANPVWRLMPEELSFLTGGQHGPVTTVHPLGGLVMADHGADGVVNPIGQVFTSESSADVHDGLVVLDGSIVPSALGTNPALTIAALALRSAEQLATDWGYDAAPALAAPLAPFERPVYRETDEAVAVPPTEVEVIERLYGPVQFAPQGGPVKDWVVELTMRFDPKAIGDLNPGTQGEATLVASAAAADPLTRSEIRIFEKPAWDALAREWDPPALRERKLDALASFRAPVTGTLKVLQRGESWFLGRFWRAGTAWLWNRGLRDIYQTVVGGGSGPPGPGWLSRVKSGIALASRAGEVRNLVYDLRIGTPEPDAAIALDGDRILGVKRFTYNRRGNPWRQLMNVELEAFPGLDTAAPRVLELDTGYLARIGVPLFRITRQADSVHALADLAGFVGYFLRLLLGIHIWSFRAPDEWPSAPTDVFEPPPELPLSDGSTVPAEVVQDTGEIGWERPDMARSDALVEGHVRITRYPNPASTRPPVVLFHGYSAGGTTFAHHAVAPNFASHLWESGRDVLIADLRTSPYYKDTTATQPWSFDQIAAKDVPWVIDKALDLTGADKVDVVAHCMGTIVVSRAILQSGVPPVAAKPLHEKIRRVAFTQVGPLVVFSPINLLRGYVMQYLVEFLPDAYQFRPDDPTLADDLWDRVLATLPYPVEEFDIENPILPWKRTPWTQTRHRMDALYGRDFSVTRMDPGVLDHIDEHFGALSLRTVASTLHFARNDLMTTHRGRNDLVSRDLFGTAWKEIDTFSLHGGDNGLSDVATVSRMEKILHDSGVQYLAPHVIEGAGHQDCLIGANRLETFEHVRAFLDANLDPNTGVPNEDRVAYPPWIGPVMTREEITGGGPLVDIARVGAAPSHRRPEGVVLLRVHVSGDQILKPDQTSDWNEAHILSSMVVYKSEDLEKQLWDAFEILPAAMMPNHDPNNPGNATLVLIVYNESPLLAPFFGAPYFRVENMTDLVNFDRSGNRYDFDPRIINLQVFTAMRDSVRHALVRDRLMERPTGRDDDLRILFRGAGEVKRVVVDPTTDAGLRQAVMTQMQFGPDPAFGEAALESLIEHNFGLHDGIIPDRKPQPVANATRFMFGSCQYPAGMLDEPVAYRSYAELAWRLQGRDALAPRFLLLVGDQVYTDATAGLFDPRDLADRYRTPYENWLRARPVRTALRSAPSYMLLDDHEIVDNFEPIAGEDHTQTEWFKEAMEGYEKFQHGLSATRIEFAYDGFPFFLLDTRRTRDPRQVGALNQAKLFEPQVMTRLETFLSTHPGPKFIVTPSMFLPRHRRAIQRDARLDPGNLAAIHSDGWDGYPGTMRQVLLFLAKHQIGNVVFLSGDEHRACLARGEIHATDGTLVTRFTSVHTSAMWAPYPFANGKAAETIDTETFEISDGLDQFACTVNVETPAPGDGATYVSVQHNGADWVLDCEFSDGSTRAVTLS